MPGRLANHLCRLLVISLAMLSLCFMGLIATAQTPTPSPSPTTPRRPLPKPASGARGFEKFAGRDASDRLIAAGATRQTVNPRHPVAPLEGRAYEARPFFAWEIAPGSKAYHFAIYEGDVDQNKSARLVYQTDVTATELLYPNIAPRLRPGVLYSWKVSTRTSGGKEDGSAARFAILSGAEAAEVRQALATAGLSSPKTPADRLDQARVFENYGVWYDALRIASELAENPNDKDAQAFYEALLLKLDAEPDQ